MNKKGTFISIFDAVGRNSAGLFFLNGYIQLTSMSAPVVPVRPYQFGNILENKRWLDMAHNRLSFAWWLRSLELPLSSPDWSQSDHNLITGPESERLHRNGGSWERKAKPQTLSDLYSRICMFTRKRQESTKCRANQTSQLVLGA
jgi:hypothetical protein